MNNVKGQHGRLNVHIRQRRFVTVRLSVLTNPIRTKSKNVDIAMNQSAAQPAIADRRDRFHSV
jgi:hypothetical protein